MLVVHPQSTCDICLEGYLDGTNVPHAISCGHIFCLKCLQSLNRLWCPLCRAAFSPLEIRRLHIDRNASALPAPSSSASSSASDTFNEEKDTSAQEYQAEITRVIREGRKLPEAREIVDRIHSWLRSQPRDRYADLRACTLLLHRTTDMFEKEIEDARLIKKMRENCDELRERLAEAERRSQDLQKELDERDTELVVAKSLRQHYSRLDAEWSGKYEIALIECQRLNGEVKRLKRDVLQQSAVPRIADDGYHYLANSAIMSKEDFFDESSDSSHESFKEEIVNLSPLGEISSRLASEEERSEIDDGPTCSCHGRSDHHRESAPIPIRAPGRHFSTDSYFVSQRHLLEDDQPGTSHSAPQRVERGAPLPSPSRVLATTNHAEVMEIEMTTLAAPRRSALTETRPSLGREDSQRELWRAQLRDILESPVQQSDEAFDYASRPVPENEESISIGKRAPLHRTFTSPHGIGGAAGQPSGAAFLRPSLAKKYTDLSVVDPRTARHIPERSHLGELVIGGPSFQAPNSRSSSPESSEQPNGAVSNAQGETSPLPPSTTTPSPSTSIPRPVLISRASSHAREVERMRAENPRKETTNSPLNTSILSSSLYRDPQHAAPSLSTVSRNSSVRSIGRNRNMTIPA